MIALTFNDGSHGMRCELAPGCTPLPCKNRGGNTCEHVDNQFQIVKQDNHSNRIKNGNTVLLRSVNSPSNWLDCSDTQCIISPCNEDNVQDPGNSSYLSNCSKHHFQVYGLNRAPSKVLSVNHLLQFSYSNSERFLSCRGKDCKLLADGECPNRPYSAFPNPPDDICPKEYFKATKLSEI